MDIKKSLIELGFPKNEAAVYMALIELGITQAGPLVKKTKLHRMLVYNALDRFVDDGYASVVRKKNIQLFQATDPSIIVDQIKKKQELAQSVLKDIRKLQQAQPQAVTVRTLIGQEGFVTNMKDIVESAARQKDKTMRILGGARDTEFYEVIGDWYADYKVMIDKYGVRKLLVAPSAHSAGFKKYFAKEKNTELRTLPGGLNTPLYTRITEEMVSFEMYKPEILIIQIRNSTIAKNYLDSFELLWKTGR